MAVKTVAPDGFDLAEQNVADKRAFHLGFEVARRLAEPSFRARIRALGLSDGGCTVIAADREQTVSQLIARVNASDVKEALVAVADDGAPHGIALYAIRVADGVGRDHSRRPR